MKFFIKTLGCKMNQLDSARLRSTLTQAGYEAAESEQAADYVVVNSCAVTATSERKSRKAANAAINQGLDVAVMGCAVRANQDKWQSQFPNIPLHTSDTDLLNELGILDQDIPFPVTSRTRLPVAIQNGCDDTCSFCITRIARGPHRNYSTESIVNHINDAYQKDVREVVITGINLAAWGCENTKKNPEGGKLHELLSSILAETDMPRIRLSSLGPQYLHDGFFDVLANERICDHLHLSVQSGSPTVLKRMDRGHDDEQVYRVAEYARSVRPDVALAADFIAGFSGETQEEAEQTMTMVERIKFSKLHVFPFSPREGTPAEHFGQQVDGGLRKQRAKALREAGRSSRKAFINAQMHKPASILMEHDGTGLTTNYIRLTGQANEGEIISTEINQNTLADRF